MDGTATERNDGNLRDKSPQSLADEEAAIGASGEETAHGLFDNPDPRGLSE